MKIHYDNIEWGPKDRDGDHCYYFYWWNWLPKRLNGQKIRYFGFEQMYYDGPINSFGFWFFNWSWFTQWTKCKEPRG